MTDSRPFLTLELTLPGQPTMKREAFKFATFVERPEDITAAVQSMQSGLLRALVGHALEHGWPAVTNSETTGETPHGQ